MDQTVNICFKPYVSSWICVVFQTGLFWQVVGWKQPDTNGHMVVIQLLVLPDHIACGIACAGHEVLSSRDVVWTVTSGIGLSPHLMVQLNIILVFYV